MTPQSEDELQQRLRQLEAEIKSSAVEDTQSQKSQFGVAGFNSQLTRLRNWFDSLSGTKKLVVVGVTALLGLGVLQTVLRLVASVISLAVLAVLVYVGYKFFVSSSFQHKK
jgi:hypothetical protein